MNSVNIHDAKTHLSKLVERVTQGETVILARAGKPVAQLAPLDAPLGRAPQRTGFLIGRVDAPDDFDLMGTEAITTSFEG